MWCTWFLFRRWKRPVSDPARVRGVSVTMSPPATVAHFKHRVPVQSDSGPCNDQLPPAKRARESPPAAAASATAAVPDEESKAAGGSSPQVDKKFVIKWKCPLGEECASKGNYDISDPETLDCSICSHPLSLPVYQVIVSYSTTVARK